MLPWLIYNHPEIPGIKDVAVEGLWSWSRSTTSVIISTLRQHVQSVYSELVPISKDCGIELIGGLNAKEFFTSDEKAAADIGNKAAWEELAEGRRVVARLTGDPLFVLDAETLFSNGVGDAKAMAEGLKKLGRSGTFYLWTSWNFGLKADLERLAAFSSACPSMVYIGNEYSWAEGAYAPGDAAYLAKLAAKAMAILGPNRYMPIKYVTPDGCYRTTDTKEHPSAFLTPASNEELAEFHDCIIYPSSRRWVETADAWI